MKKLLALFALVFTCQAYAQDVPSQEVVADDQVFNMIPSQPAAEAKQEIETLQSVLAGLEGGRIAPEKAEAIFKAVESMKINNVSEEDLIKFIKTLSAEKVVNGHAKLKVFAHLLILAAIVVAIYKAYGWYKKVSPVYNKVVELGASPDKANINTSGADVTDPQWNVVANLLKLINVDLFKAGAEGVKIGVNHDIHV